MLKRLLLAAVTVTVVLFAGAYFWAVRHPEIAAVEPPPPEAFDPELVATGAMLAGLGNCSSCHSVPGRPAYSGGLATETPFGSIVSTNITPDPDSGIGTWSEAAFARALRQGIDRDGDYLYPVFPYDHFTLVSDADLSALYAYFMTRDPAEATEAENALRFPFGFRPLLAGWRALYLDDRRFEPDPDRPDAWNRGAYLVEGLGHCGACHTPRDALGGPVEDAKFAGAELGGGWFAPAMDGKSPAVVPWSRDALVNYLLDGWDRDHGIAAGPMTKVVDNLNAHLSEDDAYAMADYLLTFQPEGETDRAAIRAAAGEASLASSMLGEAEIARVADDPVLALGQEVFARSCANCHRAGADTVPLALTTSMNIPHPGNFLSVTRHGIAPPAGAMAKSMPAFPALLPDELAALAHFARWQFTDLPEWENVEAAVERVLSGQTSG